MGPKAFQIWIQNLSKAIFQKFSRNASKVESQLHLVLSLACVRLLDIVIVGQVA